MEDSLLCSVVSWVVGSGEGGLIYNPTSTVFNQAAFVKMLGHQVASIFQLIVDDSFSIGSASDFFNYYFSACFPYVIVRTAYPIIGVIG